MFQRVSMIALILMIALGGGFYAYNQLLPPQAEETVGTVYSTKDVVRGDINVGVEVKGALDASRGNSIMVPGERRYDGGSTSFVINEILVEEGDAVKKDEVLIRFDSTEIESKIDEKQDALNKKLDQLAEIAGVEVSEIDSINPVRGITLRAPIPGRIVDLDASEGKELEPGHVICRIVDDSKFRAKIKLNPVEFGMVKVGEELVLSSSEFDGFYSAKLTKLNPNPVPNNEKEDGFAKGFVHVGEVEGDNPGLIQSKMKVRVGQRIKDSDSITFFGLMGEVEGFVDEKKVLNTIEAVITEVHVDNMENVEENSAIVTMASKDIQDMLEEKVSEIRELRSDLNELRKKLDHLEITTPVNGIISHMHRQVGDTVRAGNWLGSIFNVESMEMRAQVDDIDILNVKLDAPVRVTIDAVPGEVFEGTVSHVDASSDRENMDIPKYSVRISVKGSHQLKPGMHAKGFIDAGNAKDVLLIPLEAVFQEEGKFMVEILDENGNPKLIEVKLGLMNDRLAEVKDGLNEGDKVVIGSSADLLPSQNIGSKDTLLPKADNNGNESNGEDKDN
ncbi:MAG: efflux RND transporter periplasmic adaptor subunit [Clostridia bacterium]|nr:efflux RND transporter periplasmic adaptor subunit [Clostridia bacterium]